MPARVSCCLIATAGLLLLAAALFLPVDLGHARPEPEPATPASELAVLPGDCAMFLSVRITDIANDQLARALAETMRILPGQGMKLADVERWTVVTLAGGQTIEIIRTRKPIDKKKVLASLEGKRIEYKDKAPAKEDVSEKKINGKTVHYWGHWPNRWTTGICILQRKVFVRGNMTALEALLGSKVRRSADLKAMCLEAGKHTLVAGFQGKELREMFRNEHTARMGVLRNLERLRLELHHKEKAPSGEGKDRETKDKQEKKTRARVIVPPQMLPYKPLVLMKTGLVTVDIGEGYEASARVTFDEKEKLDEGEHALKTLLYVIREWIADAPETERGLRALAPLSEPVEKALKAAKIHRKSNTLETSVKLTVAPGVAKKVSADLAAERKRREEEQKKFVPKDIPKDGFKDKK
jgi:hypothetical protein